jgi:hypothetical protein
MFAVLPLTRFLFDLCRCGRAATALCPVPCHAGDRSGRAVRCGGGSLAPRSDAPPLSRETKNK